MNNLDLMFIRNKRKEKGLTLRQMAKSLGFSNPSVYYKYETGIYSFKAKILPALAKILQCNINNFFNKNSSKIETRKKKTA